MPLDGHDSTPRQPPDRLYPSPINVDRKNSNKMLGKRIMMNPPDTFVQAALAASPVIPVNNAIVFDQGGQAVMVPPGALEEGGDEVDNTPAGQESDTPQAASPATQAQSQTQTQVQVPVQVPTQTQATVDPTTTAAESRSIIDMVTTQVTTATVTPTSAVTQGTTTDNPSPTSAPTDTTKPTSSDPASTMPNMRMSSSAPSSPTSASISSSSTSSAAVTSSAAAAATSEPPKPFTRSAPFIFLMVLGSLVIVAVAATLFSTFFKWKDSCGCLPCCRPDQEDDDEDGLSDLVRSFDLERTSTAGLSRASSMRRPPPMMDARQRSLQNRSTLFANSPSQAGFLHTTSGVEGSIFESEDEKTSTDHLYGGHGQGGLEIKNAVEGDIPGENESLHGIGPRHLGVEGNGLEVPWRPAMPLRAYTGSEASYGEHHPQANPNNVPDIPFPSPPVTINEQPTRASTWASNLRSTLFAAISTPAHPQAREDRYTRQVLPLHRNSTMKSTMSLTDNDSQFGRPYPLVINEADKRELDASTSEVGKRFMMNRDESKGSDASRETMTMTMGDKYKSWSRGGTAAWPKPVLAGGGRARGVSNQYV